MTLYTDTAVEIIKVVKDKLNHELKLYLLGYERMQDYAKLLNL